MQSSGQQQTLVRLDEKYVQNVLPYQTIVQTISLHNTSIYALQQQYTQLQQQYNKLKAQVQLQEQALQQSKVRHHQLKKERNHFIQEALSVRQKQFDELYRSKRMQRLQEIGLKYNQIAMMKSPQSEYNIFFNLEEGLLQQVIHQLQECGEQQLRKDLKSWLQIYQASIRKQPQ